MPNEPKSVKELAGRIPPPSIRLLQTAMERQRRETDWALMKAMVGSIPAAPTPEPPKVFSLEMLQAAIAELSQPPKPQRIWPPWLERALMGTPPATDAMLKALVDRHWPPTTPAEERLVFLYDPTVLQLNVAVDFAKPGSETTAFVTRSPRPRPISRRLKKMRKATARIAANLLRVAECPAWHPRLHGPAKLRKSQKRQRRHVLALQRKGRPLAHKVMTVHRMVTKDRLRVLTGAPRIR